MNMKIGWYREVLELEPDSRLFLPLARLLAEEGEVEEACRVLREGLLRHPTFLEARLTYVDLLRRARHDDEGRAQLESLVSSLAAHDGFWQTWAAGAADSGELDASLAIRLLSLVVRGVRLDFADILRRGIESLEAEYRAGEFDLQHKMGDQTGARQAGQLHPVATPLRPTRSTAPVSPVPTAAAVSATPVQEALAAQACEPAAASPLADPVSANPEGEHREPQARPGEELEPAVEAAQEPADPAGAEQASSMALADGDGADGVADDGPWPPRTRTMAEVLAEQGDIDAACDIYAELEARARTSTEAAEYAARREELRRRALETQSDLESEAADMDRDEHPAPARLGPESLGMLNALVNSLQGRVH